MAELLDGEPPRVVLLPDDTFGKVAAPLLAGELDARLVTGATGITVGTSRIVIARPIFDGGQEALIEASPEEPLVATLIPGAVGEGSGEHTPEHPEPGSAPPHAGRSRGLRALPRLPRQGKSRLWR